MICAIRFHLLHRGCCVVRHAAHGGSVTVILLHCPRNARLGGAGRGLFSVATDRWDRFLRRPCQQIAEDAVLNQYSTCPARPPEPCRSRRAPPIAQGGSNSPNAMPAPRRRPSVT